MATCLGLIDEPRSTQGTYHLKAKGKDTIAVEEKVKEEKIGTGKEKEKEKEKETEKNGVVEDKDKKATPECLKTAMEIEYLPLDSEEFDRIVKLLRKDVGDLVVRLDKIFGNKELYLQAWLLFYQLLSLTSESIQRRISFMATVCIPTLTHSHLTTTHHSTLTSAQHNTSQRNTTQLTPSLV
mgnify:CR=1 FL=1